MKTLGVGRQAMHAVIVCAGTAALVVVSGVGFAAEPLPAPPTTPLVSPVVTPTAPIAPVMPPRTTTPTTGSTSKLGAAPLAAAAAAPTTVAAGRTPGTFAVSNSGAATYSIPLWMPPGIGSLQLGLSLVYNSRAPNGVLGQGWALSGLSAIIRCNRSWAQDGAPAAVTNTLADRFCLDGQQLKLMSAAGTYGQAGSTYATEIESFSRIEAFGAAGNGPAWFRVTTKNGLIYEYGGTPDSQIQVGGGASTTIRAWALNRISDRAGGAGVLGNQIKLSYTKDTTNGTYRINEINYPYTTTGQGPFYTVSFAYAVRPTNDLPSGYLAGYLSQEVNQLNSISVAGYGSATPIKTYYLGYGQGSATSRLRLASVQECGATSCFPSTTVQYQDGTTVWNTAATVSSQTTSQPAKLTMIDMNGDGTADAVYPKSVGSTLHWWVMYGSSSGFGTAVDTGAVTGLNDRIVIGDFNGDARQDFLYPSGGTWYLMRHNDSSLVSASTGVAVSTTNSTMTAADIDGDGLPDMLWVDSGNLVLRRNTTTPGGAVAFATTTSAAWSSGVAVAIPSYGNSSLATYDFNGDGRADTVAETSVFLYFSGDVGPVFDWYMVPLISQGTTMVAGPPIFIDEGGSDPGPGGVPTDWNGDGCTDLIVIQSVYVSKCDGTFAAPFAVPGVVPSLSADLDGDGRMDAISISAGTLVANRSTGTGVLGGFGIGIGAGSGAWSIGDVDGDALGDLVWVDQAASNTIKLNRHTSPGVAADLATTFTDGFGMSQTVSYVPMTWNNYSKYADAVFPEADYAGPLYVASQFTASDGTGSTFQNQFWYYAARVHMQGRGFEGFWAQRIYDTRTGFYTYDYVQRQFPYTGMFNQRLVQQGDGATNVFYSTTTPNYQISGGSGYEQRWFPFISNQTDSQYEYGGALNGTMITQRQTTTTYGDGYGNPTLVVVTVTDKDPTSPFYNSYWASTGTTTFSNSTSNWCLGMPAAASISNAAPGQTQVTRNYSYASDAAYCRVTQQVIEPSNAQQIVTSTLGFAPAACGNVSSVQVQGANSNGSAMAARTTSFGYGTRCQLPESVTNALSQSSAIAYNYSFGVPSSVTDPNGVSTSWLYDDFGRWTRETRPDGTYSTASFGLCNSVNNYCGAADLRFIAEIVDRASDATQITYRDLYFDGFDRVRYEESLHAFNRWKYDRIVYYNAIGRPVYEYLPLETASNGYRSWMYDPLGRVTNESVSQPNGTLHRSTWIAYAGRTTSVTDPLAHTRSQVSDVLGRLRRVVDPSPGGTTYYDYDAFGNLNRIQDPLGGVSTGSYNLRGFRTQWADADAGTWIYYGNSLNELTSWSDAKGQSFSATYDSLGRLTSRTEPEGTSTFVFGTSAAAHNIGRLASVSGLGYSETLGYDGIGRLSNRSITLDQTYQYDYTYNPIGAIDTITYPASPTSTGQAAARFRTQYLYSNGYLQQIKDANTESTFYYLSSMNDYDSPTVESLGNGVTIASTYKPWTNELTAVSSVVGTAPKQNLSYIWDAAGNLTQRADGIRSLTENFGYDTLDRLTSVTGSTTLTVGYDANGNITSKSDVGAYTYGVTGKPNRLASAGGSTLSYDANGNVTSRGSGKSLTFTSFNLPSLVTDGALQTTFAYGPDHQRVQSFGTYSDGTATTRYIGGLLEKMTPSTGAEEWRHYVPTPSGEVVVRRWASANDTRYVLTDHLGSTDAVLNASGTLLVAESFDAFGKRRNGATWSGVPSLADKTQIASTTRDGFTGHEMVDTIGLVHMGGRMYDPSLGRFLSVDPLIGSLGDSQQVGSYGYVGNRPLSRTDPTGLELAPCGFWCQAVYVVINSGILQGLLGGHHHAPPAAISIPGTSAQSGTGLCGAGTNSPTCGGLILYQGAPIAGGDFMMPGMPPLVWSVPVGVDCGCGGQANAPRGRGRQKLPPSLEQDVWNSVTFAAAYVYAAMRPMLSSPHDEKPKSSTPPSVTNASAQPQSTTVGPGQDPDDQNGRDRQSRFGSERQLIDHFTRHGTDFGARSAAEYEAQASRFLNGPRNSRMLETVRTNGDIVRYDPATEEFGVLRKDGTIRTYYKPDPSVHGYPSNLDYFLHQ